MKDDKILSITTQTLISDMVLFEIDVSPSVDDVSVHFKLYSPTDREILIQFVDAELFV